MTSKDFLCLTPLMIIAGAAVIIMLTIAITRNFKLIFWFSIIALLASLISVFSLIPVIPLKLSQLLVFDSFSLLFSGIIIIASLFIVFLSYNYLLDQENEKEEYFIILFVATLGSLLLVSVCNFISFFLAIETLSISLFILIAYRRSKSYSIEAGVKYLILASAASSFLLFGMGLIYCDTGSLEFEKIAIILKSSNYNTPLLLTGFSMMIVGLGFKLALAPFHMWTPDVYQGAPTPVTAYVATISKGAVMALFLRFFYDIHGFQNPDFVIIISGLAILSMFIGNILAIRQQNLKRLLAFSSIANLGYLLVTLLIGNEKGIHAAIFYLVAYIITTLGAFGIVSLLSTRDYDADKLEDYKGLFWKQPWVAIVFTLVLLSLAGIPLTAGFMSKFYIVYTGINSGLWLLIFSLIVNSVIGLYYYLRVITTLYMPAGTQKLKSLGLTGKFLLGFVALAILWLGILPDWFFQLIERYAGLK